VLLPKINCDQIRITNLILYVDYNNNADRLATTRIRVLTEPRISGNSRWTRKRNAEDTTRKGGRMSKSTAAKNKAIVLEAFETLFNKRDYAAAERFWSPNYIQHSAHIAPGREGLFGLVKSLPDTLKYEHDMIVAEGNLVIVHGRFSGFGAPASWIGRALGCHSRRSNTCAVQERESDVRQFISRIGTSAISTADFRRRGQTVNGFERKELSYAAVATHSSRRTFRCRRT